MPEPSLERKWFALYTRSRFEKKVEKQLLDKSIETYLPLRPVMKFWSDRKKWVDEPLFGCYIFVHTTPKERYLSVQTAGVVRVIAFRGKPVVVQDEEIDRIRFILREKQAVEPCEPVHSGDWVKIMRGPLAGLEGRLESVRDGSRLVVNIESIRQAIRFTISREDITVMKSCTP